MYSCKNYTKAYTMENNLLNRLSKEVLIFDGGIGTEIYKSNVFINRCYEELSVSSPDLVTQIHQNYFDAGADVLTTNTFGANKNKLSRFGLEDKVKEINTAGINLAKICAEEETLIAGSVGPIGDIPYNSGISEEDIIEMLNEHVVAVKEAGADFIMFETLSCLKEVNHALASVENVSDIPFVLSFAVNRDCESFKGETIEKLLSVIKKYKNKPTAIGLNCGVGPEGLLSALEIMSPICKYPIIAQPNAGVPRRVDNRTIYMANPEYLTTYALRFVDLGVRGVGGCCGTTPEHIQDIARSIRPLAKQSHSFELDITSNEIDFKDPVSLEERSSLGAKIINKEWIKTVEIVPPYGYELDKTIEKAVTCRDAGVDAINIPDGPRASSRISPLVAAIHIKEKAGIEPILHFCCRDRNLIGMQSDLLGCAASDIKNLLFVTGDPPKLGEYPFASAVFDADSIGMVKIQSNLNKGVDIGGKSISRVTEGVIGVGADPNALDFDREIRRIKEKIFAGAEYVITQPVFDIDALFKFLDQISDYDIPVIAGIWPLASYRNAEFMNNEVPGVSVPDHIMRRMAAAKTKDEQRFEGINIARECVDKIRNSIHGIQVSAPFGNVNTAIKVLK
jgi:methionine synthase / methylenetetrahydrofolate reductase(NADPH)